MSYLNQLTSPTELLTLAEVKLHCRVDSAFTADDLWFATAIQAAREYAEAYQSRAWGQRTYRYVLDGFPRVIKLPVVPLFSVTSLTYMDVNGEDQEIEDFLFDPFSSPPRVTPLLYHIWPVTAPVPSSVVVIFVAGATALTARTKLGMLSLILFWYEHRGDDAADVPAFVNALFDFDRWGANQC